MQTSTSSLPGMTRRQALASFGAAALGFAAFPLVKAAHQGTR